MAALWRRLVWGGILTGCRRKKKQELREGDLGRGDHLVQHSEVSERRLGGAQKKDMEQWMELGPSQGVN